MNLSWPLRVNIYNKELSKTIELGKTIELSKTIELIKTKYIFMPIGLHNHMHTSGEKQEKK